MSSDHTIFFSREDLKENQEAGIGTIADFRTEATAKGDMSVSAGDYTSEAVEEVAESSIGTEIDVGAAGMNQIKKESALGLEVGLGALNLGYTTPQEPIDSKTAEGTGLSDAVETCEISVTPTQYEIITHELNKDEALQILSGPGAGKTTTLVHKIAYMIDEFKIKPRNILVLSMTNKAVDNLKQSLLNILKNQELVDKLNVMTFNGFCHRLVNEHDNGFLETDIIEDAGWRTLKQLTPNMKTLTKFKIQAIVRDLSRIAATPDTDGFEKATLGIARKHEVSKEDLHELERVMRSMKVMTHSDVMARCKKLLEDESVKLRHEITVIDEFQDMYQEMFDIARLVSKDSHLIIAGDTNQSIYGFLGADTSKMKKQLHQIKKVKTIEMKESFRSSPEIVKCAKALLHQKNGYFSANDLENFLIKEGPKPIFSEFENSNEIYNFVASEAHRLIRESEGVIKPSDIAVLTTNNAQIEKVSKVFGHLGLRTNKLSSSPAWVHNNLFHLVDYLRILNDPKHADFPILCTLDLLDRVGPTAIRGVYSEASALQTNVFDVLPKSKNNKFRKYAETIQSVGKCTDLNDPESIFKNVLKLGHELGLTAKIFKTITDENDEKTILRQLTDFKENLEMLNYLKPNDQRLSDFFLANYNNILPISSLDESVKVSTIHSAKGLEFPIVFLPEFKVHGSKPSGNHYSSFKMAEEEKRVLYVAMTRAKTLLYMQCSRYDLDPKKNLKQVFSNDLVSYDLPDLDSSLLNTFRKNKVKPFDGHGLPFGLAKNFFSRSFHTLGGFARRLR